MTVRYTLQSSCTHSIDLNPLMFLQMMWWLMSQVFFGLWNLRSSVITRQGIRKYKQLSRVLFSNALRCDAAIKLIIWLSCWHTYFSPLMAFVCIFLSKDSSRCMFSIIICSFFFSCHIFSSSCFWKGKMTRDSSTEKRAADVCKPYSNKTQINSLQFCLRISLLWK